MAAAGMSSTGCSSHLTCLSGIFLRFGNSLNIQLLCISHLTTRTDGCCCLTDGSRRAAQTWRTTHLVTLTFAVYKDDLLYSTFIKQSLSGAAEEITGEGHVSVIVSLVLLLRWRNFPLLDLSSISATSVLLWTSVGDLRRFTGLFVPGVSVSVAVENKEWLITEIFPLSLSLFFTFL